MSDEVVQNDRLLALEGSVREISFETGQIKANQENLLVKIEEGFSGLQKGHNSILEGQAALDTRLKPLEEKEAKKAKRSATIKKILVPVAVAMAGVFGAKFGNVIYDAVLKVFN